MKQATQQSVRIFENELLEKLTHVHPLTPLFFWVPVVGVLLFQAYSSGISKAPFFGLASAGLLTWTLVEYLLHRFVFHFEGQGGWSYKLYFLIHGLHHADPQDPTRLVMPPAASLLFGSVLFLVFYALLGPLWVFPFYAFFLVGYLCYDYIHFAIHHYPLKGKIGCFLRAHHMKHHYVCPQACWGVSSPLWDHVFGTLKE